MSTVVASAEIPNLAPTPRLLTAADFAVMPDELPSGPVKYELEDGRLVVMPLPGGIHGAVNANIVFQLKLQGDQRGYGKTLAETGVVLRRGPDRVVGPDSCFAVVASLPLDYSPEGFLTAVPALIVEVRSKNDTTAELERKAGEYLAAGRNSFGYSTRSARRSLSIRRAPLLSVWIPQMI